MIKVKSRSKEHRENILEATRFNRKGGSPGKNRFIKTADQRNHSN